MVSSPKFVAGSGNKPTREPSFLGSNRGRRGHDEPLFAPRGDANPVRSATPTATESASPEAAPAPEPKVPSQPQIDFGERVAAAVSALRLHSERLAEHAREDAVELALLLARRIVEGELGAGVEPLLRVVKGVIRRAGESRRVIVHLCPTDAANVEQAGGPRGLSGVGAAQIELVADPSLGPGDCVVDADFGTIDARLDTRFAELRRLLDEAVAGGER